MQPISIAHFSPLYDPGALRNLRKTTNEIRWRALYRLPRIYREAVRAVTLLTLICDTAILATNVGQLFNDGYKYAWLAAVLTSLLNFVFLTFVILLVENCMGGPAAERCPEIPSDVERYREMPR